MMKDLTFFTLVTSYSIAARTSTVIMTVAAIKSGLGKELDPMASFMMMHYGMFGAILISDLLILLSFGFLMSLRFAKSRHLHVSHRILVITLSFATIMILVDYLADIQSILLWRFR